MTEICTQKKVQQVNKFVSALTIGSKCEHGGTMRGGKVRAVHECPYVGEDNGTAWTKGKWRNVGCRRRVFMRYWCHGSKYNEG